METMKIRLLNTKMLGIDPGFKNGDIIDVWKNSNDSWFSGDTCILSAYEYHDKCGISWERVEDEVEEKTYRVKWEIDIDAPSPEEAAKKALEIQRNKESIATVFEVTEQPKIVDMGA